MILEVALLQIIESKTDEFEINFKKASEIIYKKKDTSIMNYINIYIIKIIIF